MQKIKPLYDSKVIMIDLNFHFIDDGNLDLLLSTQKMIKKLTASQNLVLLTDCDIDYCINKVKDWNLTSGYLVANSGSIIYNFATKAIVDSHELDKTMVVQVIKQALWNNLNFIIHTKANPSYVYQLNPWLVKKYKFDLSRLFELDNHAIKVWDNVPKIIEKNGILSVEIFFYEKDRYLRKEMIQKFISVTQSIWKFNYSVNDGIVSIFSQDSSKLIASKLVAENKGIEFEDNSIYIGIDQMDEALIKTSYFSVVYDKLFDFSSIDFDVSSVEKIIVGDGDWISWLDKNGHLWTDPSLELLKKNLNNYQYVNLKTSEEDELKNNKYRFLNLNISKEEVFLHNPSVKVYSWHKKGVGDDNNKIKKLFFWNWQTEHLLSLLKTKKHY